VNLSISEKRWQGSGKAPITTPPHFEPQSTKSFWDNDINNSITYRDYWGALLPSFKMAWSKSTRITIMLAIDAAFFVLELGVGLLVGSLALMADAFHMVCKTV